MYNISTKREIFIADAKFLIDLLFSKRLVEKLVFFLLLKSNKKTIKNKKIGVDNVGMCMYNITIKSFQLATKILLLPS